MTERSYCCCDSLLQISWEQGRKKKEKGKSHWKVNRQIFVFDRTWGIRWREDRKLVCLIHNCVSSTWKNFFRLPVNTGQNESKGRIQMTPGFWQKYNVYASSQQKVYWRGRSGIPLWTAGDRLVVQKSLNSTTQIYKGLKMETGMPDIPAERQNEGYSGQNPMSRKIGSS